MRIRNNADQRDAPFRRLETAHAAEMSGEANRGGQVGADVEWRQPSCHRRRRTPARSTWCALEVPRIVGATEDRITRLIIGEQRRDVGLADEDAARRFEPRRDRAVLARNMIERGEADRLRMPAVACASLSVNGTP